MKEETSGKSEKTSEGNQVLERFEQVYRNYQRLSEKTQRIKRYETMFNHLITHNFLEERAKRNLLIHTNFDSVPPYINFAALRGYLRQPVARWIADISSWFREVSSKELESENFVLKEDGMDFEISQIDGSLKTHLGITARYNECPAYQEAPQVIKDIIQRLTELGFDHQTILLSDSGKLYSIDAFMIMTEVQNIVLVGGFKIEIWKREAKDYRQN